MNDLSFIISSLKSRWLNSLLSILLTAFGVTISLLIIQFGNHFQDRLKSDGKGIDIVVGAKKKELSVQKYLSIFGRHKKGIIGG